MLNLKKYVYVFLLILSSHTLAIDFETVIEDFKFNSTSKVTIDEQTIKDTQAKDLFSLISTQANISYFSQNLQAPQIFLRGGDSSHLLIVIDGIPTYDASTNQRTFNLNNLNIKNIRKIEILKGGQTVLYGGQALSGVILIETFSSIFVDKTKSNFELGVGHPEDMRLGAQSSIPLNSSIQMTPSARYIDKKTLSPVLDSNEKYKAVTENYDVGLNYKPNDSNQIFAKTFYFKDVADSPTTANVNNRQALVDAIGLEKTDELYGSAIFYKNKSAFFKPRLLINYQTTMRSFFQNPDTINTTGIHESQKANVLITRLDLTPYKSDTLTLESGLSYTKENFVSYNHTPTETKRNGTSELRGIFLKSNSKLTEFAQLDLGARLDSADNLKVQNNLHIGLVLFENTRFEWSTGYRTPSLGQRYGRFQSPDLQAETSQTYSLTQDYRWNQQTFSSLTIFDTHFNNLIVLGGRSPNLVYQNIAKSQTRGLEFSTSVNHLEHTLQLSYGYQEPWDIKNAKRLFRRPIASGSARYFYRSEKKWSFMTEGTGTGQRYDEVFGSRQKLSGYFLVNNSFGYSWTDAVYSSLRINNILNFRPQLSTEYYGEGLSALASITISI